MSSTRLFSGFEALRANWQQVDSAKYDAMTASLEKYLNAIDEPLLSICRGTVLELATGTGRVLTKIRKLPTVTLSVGIDIAPRMLAAARAKRHDNLVQCCAEQLPFASSSFDTVICPFYSFRDMDRAAAYPEIARILKPGGCFGFTLRNFFITYLETFWQQFLCAGRLPRSLRTLDGANGVNYDLVSMKAETGLIEAAGLRVVAIKTLQFLPFLRRFIAPGYWPGRLGTKLGSDIIIITEKR